MVWPIVSLVVGVIGVAVAVVPFYTDAPFWIGAIGALVGLGGLAAGIVGLLQARRNHVPAPALAVSGVVAAGVAVVLALSSVLVHVNSSGSDKASGASSLGGSDITDDLAVILRDQLDVTIGEFEYTVTDRGGWDWVESSKLPVTFHNKMSTARSFNITIAGFSDEHTQIDDDTGDLLVHSVLAPNATVTVDYFKRGVDDPDVAEKLKTAEFRAIMGSSMEV